MGEQNFGILRVPNFRKYYATNVYVYSTDIDFRVEVLNEKFPAEEREESKTDEYVSDALLILTPEAAKKLRDKLDEQIKSFEEKMGKIEVSPSRKLP